MIEEIKTAFKGVTREGGVSWSETVVIDDYGTREERAAARTRDKDKTWLEIANDPKWDFNVGLGRHNFLDPIGFRYYLPAAMMAVLTRAIDTSSLELSLRSADEFDINKRSLLNDRQLACVKHFIKHMIHETNNTSSQQNWRKLYESYWKQIPEVPMRKR